MKIEIPFNIAFSSGEEIQSLQQLVSSLAGGGCTKFSDLMTEWLLSYSGTSSKVYLTHSCTAALEMASILCGIGPGDEVIMPSYTYVTTANAFVLHGAIPVFVDVRPDTMNISEEQIETAITPKTKAIVAMHYGGVCCNMDMILQLAQKHDLLVIEDAATAFPASINGKPCGSLGDFGCLSFDITKNVHGFGGGALLLNNPEIIEKAELVYQRGTNRGEFLLGKSGFYEWTDKGGSYSMNELTAAFLSSQLLHLNVIQERRTNIWNTYSDSLGKLAQQGKIMLQSIPDGCNHSAHLFYIKGKDRKQRDEFISQLAKQGIETAFHYIPLHTSSGGRKYGRFYGKDIFTTAESERLVRLPLYPDLTDDQVNKVIGAVQSFFDN